MTSTSQGVPEQPIISQRRTISSIWILPIVALLIGGWMLYHNWTNRGELITISFITADGIEAGQTAIKVRNVTIGKVESVRLNGDEDGVLVKARIEPEARSLLKQENQFWVVKPRIGAGGVSGLNTLFSGAYIEMAPGKTGRALSIYAGREDPPITSATEPGLRLKLVSDNANSLSVGDTVLYRGFPVGRIEHIKFDTQKRQAVYDLFIRTPFDQLVTTDTRFWNTSGISLNLSAEGLNIQTGTIDTIVAGGVAFDTLEGMDEGNRTQNGDIFQLYPDFKSVKERPYAFYNEYLLMFDQSVRGLIPGAPVEYRGVRIGTVKQISFRLQEGPSEDPRIPVIIRIEPGRLGLQDSQDMLDKTHDKIRYWVQQGMRASLKSGSLVTGSLLINFDLYSDLSTAELTTVDGYTQIPTISGGLVQVENKLLAVLVKIQQLPLEPVIAKLDNTLTSSDKAIIQLNHTLKALETTLQSQSVQALPQTLNNTLQEISAAAQGLSPESQLYQELNSTLRSLQTTVEQLQPLLKTLDQKPNALIFDAPKTPDPIPGGQQ